MKMITKIILASALFVAVCFASWAGPRSDVDVIRVGGTTYEVPSAYGASGDGPDERGVSTMFVQLRKNDLGPLTSNVTGWGDNINLLLSDITTPVKDTYDWFWDGDPTPPSWKNDLMFSIVKTRKINENLTYHEMGSSSSDVIIVTDDKGQFDGFMLCTKHKMNESQNACKYIFNKENKRWELTFGIQFILEYDKIKDAVILTMRKFEGKS